MLTQPRTWGSNWSHVGDICFFKQNKLRKKSLKPESQMLRGVVYRLIEYLASMEHSSIWKLICAIRVSNILAVGVHLSSTPSISGPGSATGRSRSNSFENLITRRDCMQQNPVFSRLSLIIGQLFTHCLNSYQMFFHNLLFSKKMIPEFQKAWNSYLQ